MSAATQAIPITDATQPWSYDEAFSRHSGLISPEQQQKLRHSCVAIAGMGGVGGCHLATLARLGITRFRIADPDHYDVANTNRQYGAKSSTVGEPKVEVMSKIARDINPEIEIDAWHRPLALDNCHEFLDGVDVLLDGMDLLKTDVRRTVFKVAAEQGTHVVTAGPFGFSIGWMVFEPGGIGFDDYFDMHDGQTPFEQMLNFIGGLTPDTLYLKYMDVTKEQFTDKSIPSLGLACQMCAGVAATEVTKILIGVGRVKAAPYYFQFDALLQKFRHGKLRGGNRHPKQRLKLWLAKRQFRKMGLLD